MANGVTIKIRGFKQLSRNLKRLGREARPIARSGLKAAAQSVLAEIRSRVPVITGKLRNNIVVRLRTRRGVARAEVFINEQGKAGDEKNAFYWRFVEFGTHGRTGKPFLRESWEAKRQQAVQVAFTKVKEGIRRFRGV